MRLLPFSSSSCSSSNGSPVNEQSDGGDHSTPVYLNVYDISRINNYLYCLGLGAYHSGIEAHGMEFAFGGHEYSSSGVFQVEPKQCPGFIFRSSILLGVTDMSCSEFRSFMRDIAAKYHGNTYHLISKNCNHFTNEACVQLTGNPIPGWVNRLAKAGSFCNCFIPGIMHSTRVRHVSNQSAYSDDDVEEDYESDPASSESEFEEPDRHLLPGSSESMTILREKRERPTNEYL